MFRRLLDYWKNRARREDVLALFTDDRWVNGMDVMDQLEARGKRISHGLFYSLLRGLEDAGRLESRDRFHLAPGQLEARGGRPARQYRRVKPGS